MLTVSKIHLNSIHSTFTECIFFAESAWRGVGRLRYNIYFNSKNLRSFVFLLLFIVYLCGACACYLLLFLMMLTVERKQNNKMCSTIHTDLAENKHALNK